MQRAALSFALLAVLTALLVIACLFLAQKGYPFGAVGLRRLDSIASAPTFIPVAGLYFLTAALLVILPLRAASFVLSHATEVVFWAAIALIASIIGVVVARFAWGQSGALSSLVDWRFLYAAALVGAHFALDHLRKNVLLRSLFFAIFVAACAFCLFWTP
ncbi:hypothetical protein ACFOEZ_07240 [Tianweitania populi]|uniref:Uncharacterized protein n=1 Tax=Tianweitania populi TaxID=1607949 RepID=A0A8J3DMK8_9HYPH|nr:hypothetical protein [Tianweitania populi]GHD10648.1 hypothetical protein GCM10016234_12750 [Tianweitania populi]